MYQAIVAKIDSITPIEDRDRIVLASVLGFDVIVGKDYKVGDLGLYIPVDGSVSHEFAHYNNLYRKGKGENKDPNASGYLESNRRIRSMRMAKCRSEGLFVLPETLAWTDIDPSTLKEGYQFTHLNDKLVCEKYYPPATVLAMNRKAKAGKNIQHRSIDLFKHYDTPQLRYNLKRIAYTGGIGIITVKSHGTSQRQGRVLADKRLSWFQRTWNRFTAKTQLPKYPYREYTYVSGTRNINLDPDFSSDTGYYSSTDFRKDIHDHIRTLGLMKGETLFFEVVGFTDKGGLIMPPHNLDKKEHKDLIDQYKTERIIYKYGCRVLTSGEETIGMKKLGTQYKILVYRITLQDEDGTVHELSWDQVKGRCKALGLETVYEVYRIPDLAQISTSDLIGLCKQYADGPDPLDPSHIREGICLRVENGLEHKIFKWKGNFFSDLENIAKNEDFIDPEDVE